MNVSILNPADTVVKSTPIDTKTLYNLSIDRVFKYICPATDKREYFLNVISELNSDEKTVIYRQDVLKDFLNSDGLFDELCSLYSRFDELKASLKSSLKPDTRMDFSYNTSVTARKNELRAYSLALKRSLCFVRGIGEILSKHSIKSEGLNLLAEKCLLIYGSDSFEKLLSVCSKYEYLSERGILDFKYTLTDDMKIDSFEFVDHRHIRVSDPDDKDKKRFLFKKKLKEEHVCERVLSNDNRIFSPLVSGAFGDMASLLKSLTDQIFKRFLGVKNELDFYYIALRYVKKLNEKNVPCTFPVLTNNGNVNIDGLYDLFLLVQKDDAENIVPNSYSLSNSIKGTIIYGDNGSGKTVYMRAFGIMQILSQAGFPVPCNHSEIKLYSQIVTQYAESEGEHSTGEDFGRFESEVKELATIITDVREGSLILLNETFQSTSYKEGAVGLSNILDYFVRCNVTFFLVSHLHDLKGMINHEKVAVLHSQSRYIVCPVNPNKCYTK